MEWQAVVGLEDGQLVAERPDTLPKPAVEVREPLPNGTEFNAVWSHWRCQTGGGPFLRQSLAMCIHGERINTPH